MVKHARLDVPVRLDDVIDATKKTSEGAVARLSGAGVAGEWLREVADRARLPTSASPSRRSRRGSSRCCRGSDMD